jgi:hypothetical protein
MDDTDLICLQLAFNFCGFQPNFVGPLQRKFMLLHDASLSSKKQIPGKTGGETRA